MIITAHELKTEPITIKREFLNNTLSAIDNFKVSHSFGISGLNRQLRLKVLYTIDTELGKTNIVKATFSKLFDIQLHIDEIDNKKSYFRVSLWKLMLL